MTDKPDLYTAMAEALNAPRPAVKLATYMGTPAFNKDVDTGGLDDQLKAAASHWTSGALRLAATAWLLDNVNKLTGMTPEEREKQAISFAYGNAKLANPNVTLEMVQEAMAKMKANTDGKD